MKNKKDQRVRQKFKIRKKMFKCIKYFFIFCLCFIFSPIFKFGEKLDIPEKYDITLTASRNLSLVNAESFDSDKMAVEFYINNEDGSLTKDLMNIDYEIVKINTSKNQNLAANIEASVSKITDDYIVVELDKVPKNWDIMMILLKPKLINENVDMNLPEDLEYYIYQSNVKESNTGKPNFKLHAAKSQTQTLVQEEQDLKDAIKRMEADIQLNKALIERLEKEITYQTEIEQVESKQEIDKLVATNESTKVQIKNTEDKAKMLNEKINSIKTKVEKEQN